MTYIFTIFSITKAKIILFMGFMIPMTTFIDFNLRSIFSSAVEDMDFKKFSTIAVINAAFLIMFVFMSLYDYIADLVATRAEMKRRGIPTNIRPCVKFYRTMLEMVAIVAFNFFIWIFAMYSVIIDNNILYVIMLWLTAIIYAAGIVHEFDSIGKNLEKANGQKPGFFNWVDKVIKLLERATLRKLLDKCGVKDDEGIEEVVNATLTEKKTSKSLEDKK